MFKLVLLIFFLVSIHLTAFSHKVVEFYSKCSFQINLQFHPDTTKPKFIVKEGIEIYNEVDVLSEFSGGQKEMYKFLSSNIKYPNEAQRAGKGAKVYLKFIVSVDGSISDIEVMNPSGFGFDEESVRVVKLMPKWIAAYVNDKKVNSFFTLPIIFKLTNSQGKRF